MFSSNFYYCEFKTDENIIPTIVSLSSVNFPKSPPPKYLLNKLWDSTTEHEGSQRDKVKTSIIGNLRKQKKRSNKKGSMLVVSSSDLQWGIYISVFYKANKIWHLSTLLPSIIFVSAKCCLCFPQSGHYFTKIPILTTFSIPLVFCICLFQLHNFNAPNYSSCPHPAAQHSLSLSLHVRQLPTSIAALILLFTSPPHPELKQCCPLVHAPSLTIKLI